MNWILKAGNYNVWKDFSIEVGSDIALETGKSYQFTGANGSGKSSFIKKILIPFLQKDPEQQYVLYVEQQIQSQFDAIKSYAALQKPAVQLTSFRDMLDYQFKQLSLKIKQNPRPCLIILDECNQLNEVKSKLNKLDRSNYCLVVVSHINCEIELQAKFEQVEFTPTDVQHTAVT
jgi:Cdc6-like AAA superfamily ATPase